MPAKMRSSGKFECERVLIPSWCCRYCVSTFQTANMTALYLTLNQWAVEQGFMVSMSGPVWKQQREHRVAGCVKNDEKQRLLSDPYSVMHGLGIAIFCSPSLLVGDRVDTPSIQFEESIEASQVMVGADGIEYLVLADGRDIAHWRYHSRETSSSARSSAPTHLTPRALLTHAHATHPF